MEQRFACTVFMTLGIGVLALTGRVDGSQDEKQVERPDGGEAGEIVSIDPPAIGRTLAPNLATSGSEFILSWIGPAPSSASSKGDDAEGVGASQSHRLQVSWFRENGAWSGPVTVATSSDFFANWADVPGIAPGPGESLYAWWLEKSGPDTYAYDIRLARSTRNGTQWKTIGTLNDDGQQVEHGFVSWVSASDGIRFFWLDGRAMAQQAPAEEPRAPHDAGPGGGDMQLRTAVVRDGVIGPSTVLDARVCECCKTDAALTREGAVVVYRDRSAEEIRDIQIIRETPEGWTKPALVHADGWEIFACPVNGPAIAARDTLVVVAWSTEANGDHRTQVAFSVDAGRTFIEPRRVAGEASLGRVDVLLTADRRAIVAYMASTGEGMYGVYLRRVLPTGEMGEPLRVAETSGGRASGFPKIALQNDGILVTWTDVVRGTRRVRAALVDMDAID